MSDHKFSSFTDGKDSSGIKGGTEENNEEEEDESYDIDPDYLFAYEEDEHIYCETCRCSMSGPKTFEAHLAGARHKKNVKNSELGAPVRPNKVEVPTLQMKNGRNVTWKPKCQAMIDAFEKPLIGLQYVTEWCHRNRFVEPRYYCHVCKAKCDIRMFMLHMTGVKHRVTYMKLFYPEMAAKVRGEGHKTDQQAPLAEHYARQIEEKEGRRPLCVKAEGFPNCEGDEDDKELEVFIASNKQNFYRYLTGLGLPSDSQSRKSQGASGSQPTLGSSGMSRPSSDMGFSGIRSASDSGYDSMGPSGCQPSQLHTDFDPYQQRYSGVSGPMPQDRPHYGDSDYRRQSSPGYRSGQYSRDKGGQSGGYSGQSSGYGAHRQGWCEDDAGFSRDRFHSSSWNSSAVRDDRSFKPPFPSYSADFGSGSSYDMRGSRSSGWPYPANRPSRFASYGALSEGHDRFQSRY